MLQFEELKLALDELKPDLSDLEEALDLKAAGEEIEKLEAQAAEPEFWNDMSHSQKILQRTSTLKNKVSKYNALKQKFDDIQTLIELGNEAQDVSIWKKHRLNLNSLNQSWKYRDFLLCCKESMTEIMRF